MKKGQVIKNAELADDELRLINSYARRELNSDEVYVFSVILCDNDVDRDYERFTVESLEKLSEQFVGKTGIFDHNPTASNQTARIISCSVENIPGKKNLVGDDYFCLKARAYMPVLDSNKELRELIDGGILREVSVGCAVEKTLCSICGEELGSCTHRKGVEYGGKLCFGELCDPYDAYEFSFVAVPAQKGAGVVKAFSGKDKPMSDIIKSIENSEAVTLTKKDSEQLKEYIEGLKKQAADGMMYRNSLVAEVMKFSAIVQPEISRETMESVTKALSVEQLKEFSSVYRKKAEKFLPPKPQLYVEKKDNKSDSNTEFKI